MKVERLENEIIITLSASVGQQGVQDIMDYARQLELTSKNKIDPKVLDKLAGEIIEKCWAEIQQR